MAAILNFNRTYCMGEMKKNIPVDSYNINVILVNITENNKTQQQKQTCEIFTQN